MKVVNLLGINELPIQEFTGGGTGHVGDLVAIAGDDNKLDVVAANGTAAIGWLLSEMSADAPCQVLLGLDSIAVWMPKTGTFSAGELGAYFSLAGTTGAQTVNLDDTDHDLLQVLQYDSTNSLALCKVIPAAYQWGGKEV